MKFRFNVNMTPEDYFELNRIVMFEMPAGKKIINTTRIIFAAFCAVAVLFLLSYFDFSTAGVVAAILFLIITVLIQFLTKPLFNMILKSNVKSIAKMKGKPPYTEHSVIEFYDDIFVETSEDNKTEMKYSAIENVFVNDKLVVIFINKMQAYILPVASFESKEQMISLVRFISEKRQGV